MLFVAVVISDHVRPRTNCAKQRVSARGTFGNVRLPCLILTTRLRRQRCVARHTHPGKSLLGGRGLEIHAMKYMYDKSLLGGRCVEIHSTKYMYVRILRQIEIEVEKE